MRVLVASTCLPFDRLTLCVVRSLALRGADVAVGAESFLSRPFFSRFIKKRISYPHPSSDIQGFVRFLLQHLEDNEYDVLLPIYDYVTTAVALYREEVISHVKIPIPDFKVVQKSRDKLYTLEVAKKIGIEIPSTYCIEDRRDLEDIAGSIDYPCVLKLRQGFGAIGIGYPDSYEALIKCYEELPSTNDMVVNYRSPIIQEYIPGEIHTVGLLFNRGEVRAALTQKRLKMFPSSGGTGIYTETTYEPDLRDKAVMLLEKLRWHGPAQVEFKIDSRDGVAKLMEINGRFWSGLDLSIQAGINFPLLACKMEIDGDVDPVFDYRVGLRYRWPFPYAFFYMRETKGGLRSLWEFFRHEPDTLSDLWLSDPLTILSDIYFLYRRVLIGLS